MEMEVQVVDSNKEVTELIAGLVVVALAVKEVMKDGKVDAKDLPQVIALVQKQAVLIAAAKGVSEVKIKELDIALVLTQVIAAIQEVRA